MTANESWNCLCDLEEAGVPGVAEHTGNAAEEGEPYDWAHLEAGLATVARYALARQAEAAQQRVNGVAK